MGRCITRCHPEDFGEWCEHHEDTIIEAVLERYAIETFDWNDKKCTELFEKEAQNLWNDCAEDDDPYGGDDPND